MRTLEKRVTFSRRNFLKSTGIATIGITTASATTLMMSPVNAWADEVAAMGGLDAGTTKTLLKVARDIFPHDQFSDAIYMKGIEPYGQATTKDSKLKALLTDGVKDLDSRAHAKFGKPYAQVDKEEDRVSMLKAIESGPFFFKMRSDLVVSIYNNHAVWPKLGEEGSAWEKGGYIHRGFDDINWL